jgi:hypothetical protein
MLIGGPGGPDYYGWFIIDLCVNLHGIVQSI